MREFVGRFAITHTTNCHSRSRSKACESRSRTNSGSRFLRRQASLSVMNPPQQKSMSKSRKTREVLGCNATHSPTWLPASNFRDVSLTINLFPKIKRKRPGSVNADKQLSSHLVLARDFCAFASYQPRLCMRNNNGTCSYARGTCDSCSQNSNRQNPMPDSPIGMLNANKPIC